MRIPIFLTFALALVLSCESKRDPVSSEEHLIWNVIINENKSCLDLTKTYEVNPASLTSRKLAALNNIYWDNVEVTIVKVSNDTIYLKIEESGFLTQQMGTTGAASYLATTTYNFTELKGIDYVNFDFEEGDHAVPGTYKRADFDCL